jgi:hypothetical protein
MARPAEVSPQPKPAELFERRVIRVFPPHADGPAFGFSKGGRGVVGCASRLPTGAGSYTEGHRPWRNPVPNCPSGVSTSSV